VGKSNGGKAYFEALGKRRALSGLGVLLGAKERLTWPLWAREAWLSGWVFHAPMAGRNLLDAFTQELIETPDSEILEGLDPTAVKATGLNILRQAMARVAATN